MTTDCFNFFIVTVREFFFFKIFFDNLSKTERISVIDQFLVMASCFGMILTYSTLNILRFVRTIGSLAVLLLVSCDPSDLIQIKF